VTPRRNPSEVIVEAPAKSKERERERESMIPIQHVEINATQERHER
jgi:hypothetical protein